MIILDEITIGFYRHYKGREYEVLCLAKHSESLAEMVVYRALYGTHDIWVRPASMFLEKIKVNGKKVQRFELIKEANTENSIDKTEII